MSISLLKGKVVDIHLWAPVHEVESSALDQLKNIAALPWVFHHVAVMPDVHYGKGATVGSVVAMKNAVSPAAVGVDVGCGMQAVKTSLNANKVDRKLKQVRAAIEEAIPVGFNAHAGDVLDQVDDHRLRDIVTNHMAEFTTLTPKVQGLLQRAWAQVGSLGGGNHYLELCLDTDDAAWVMLHSGSRNIGKELAEYHIGVARTLAHNAELPDRDLAVFLSGTEEMRAYRHDLFWGQEYARLNRAVMMNLFMRVLKDFWPGVTFSDAVACHHNYVSEETHFGEDVLVTRKGAINAGRGVMGLIPGSMGTKSYVVRGLGNPESFNSASHGAGRRMSRGEAKRRYTVRDLEEQTRNVECRKDSGVLDEIPSAYKNIEKVMQNQRDLVEIVAELRGILCVKG